MKSTKDFIVTITVSGSEGIERVYTESGTWSDKLTLNTKVEGVAEVSIMDESVVEELAETTPGNLATGTPSIELNIGDQSFKLNWQDAYNLSEMLRKTADLALFG